MAVVEEHHGLLRENCHLFLREVGLRERIFNLHELIVKCLILCPEVLLDGEPTAERGLGTSWPRNTALVRTVANQSTGAVVGARGRWLGRVRIRARP